jgi:Heparinase II/III-like protein/Heparinase II/III N-terminus
MGRLGTMLQVGRSFGMRQGMLRAQYEFERGSGLMSWRMRSVQGWDSWDLKRIAPDCSAEDWLESRRDGTRKFFFRDAKDLGAGIRPIMGSEEERVVLAEAKRILAGHLPFFGQLSYHCGFPPRWFQNPLTGQSVSPQQAWTQMRFASPVYGDLKFILESSRFLFVYPLVRAYALTADECLPQAFWSSIEDWAHHSPPMRGPLWICGQECSLRILAWSFALHGFINSPSTTRERVALLVSMLAAHAWRTAQTLTYARSQRSNHLVSEAVGLWTAGTLFPELREAAVWRNLGAQVLHEAVLDQITSQGVGQQHSFHYQRMILHLLLWTLRLAEIHKSPLDADIRSRAGVALDFIRSWVDPVSGCVPNYGSDDGSLILPLASAAYRDYRPLLQLGAAVLGRPALESGPWDEPAIWFDVSPAVAVQEVTAPKLLTESGYFRLGNESSWTMIRAGNYTRRPFQADQLHVDLWWRGINLARDPGTYRYNGPAPFHNAFATTTVHNTITIDDRDQMRRGGRFLWLDWAQASGRVYSDRQNCAYHFEGEHDGYRTLGIKHRRRVHRLADSCWLIVDDVEGTGEHDLRLHWLTADLPFEVHHSPFQVVFTSGLSQIQWSMFCSAPAKSGVFREGKQVETSSGFKPDCRSTTLLGWEAPTYGELKPAVSFIYETRSQLPVRFATVVTMDRRYEIESTDEELVILDFGRADGRHYEIFRVSLAPARKLSRGARISPASEPRA